MPALTQSQKAHFAEKGFLVVEGVLDETALNAVEAEYEAILDRVLPKLVAGGKHALEPQGGFASRYMEAIAGLDEMYDLYQHLDISLPLIDEMKPDAALNTGPAVFTHVLRNPALLDIAESLLGPEITASPVQHTRIKPPLKTFDGQKRVLDSNVAKTMWHQDEAVIEDVGAVDMLTVWVAITDATEEMGCMTCVPGIHQAEAITTMHCPGGGVTSAEIYIPDDLVRSEAVAMPVRRGGVVLLNKRTIHASLENISDHLRWSFDLRYLPSGQPTGRSVFPSFVARSRSDPSSELTDPVAYAEAWEHARDAFVAAGPRAFNQRWVHHSEHPLCA